MTYYTLGHNEFTEKADRMAAGVFSRRWAYFGAFFASMIGVWTWNLFHGVWPWLSLACVVAAIVGLAVASRKVMGQLIVGGRCWVICSALLDPIKEGATVVISPSGHPEVPGVVEVLVPGDDDDESP